MRSKIKRLILNKHEQKARIIMFADKHNNCVNQTQRLYTIAKTTKGSTHIHVRCRRPKSVQFEEGYYYFNEPKQVHCALLQYSQNNPHCISGLVLFRRTLALIRTVNLYA